jgi:hypothetical protein
MQDLADKISIADEFSIKEVDFDIGHSDDKTFGSQFFW